MIVGLSVVAGLLLAGFAVSRLTSIRRILPLWMPPNAVLTGSGRML